MKWLKEGNDYFNTNQILRIARDTSNAEYDVGYVYLTDGRCILVDGAQCDEILNFCGDGILEVRKPEHKSSGFVIDINEIKAANG
jgi:hypothetical protein